MLWNILWDYIDDQSTSSEKDDNFRLKFAPRARNDLFDADASPLLDQNSHQQDRSDARQQTKTFGKKQRQQAPTARAATDEEFVGALPRMRRTVSNSNPLDFSSSLPSHLVKQLRRVNAESRIALDSARVKIVDDLTLQEKQAILHEEMQREQQKRAGKYATDLLLQFDEAKKADAALVLDVWLENEMTKLIDRDLQRRLMAQKSLDFVSQYAPIDEHDLLNASQWERLRDVVRRKADDDQSPRDAPQQQTTSHLQFLNYELDKQYLLQKQVMKVFEGKQHLYGEPFGPLGLEPSLDAVHPLQHQHTTFNPQQSSQQTVHNVPPWDPSIPGNGMGVGMGTGWRPMFSQSSRFSRR